MRDLLGAASERELIFGPNMTSLTFDLTRSLAHLLDPGDEILLTRIEHDANVRPWEMLAEECGLVVRRLDFDASSYELCLEQLDELVGERTRIAAINYASNVTGTINDVAAIARRVRAVGGLTFVDAVQYVPHGAVDVQALGCDFMACSAYKFFGPHLGVLWGREQVLEQLPPYKLTPASNELPWRLETGTQCHELQAGLLGTMAYLESLAPDPESRRDRLVAAMQSAAEWEARLARMLLDGLAELPVAVHGITEAAALDRRVPTIAISGDGLDPAAASRWLGERGVFTTHGDGYAIHVIERLGLADRGGVLRLGLAHYNTEDEIERVLTLLDEHLSRPGR
jgi:cysteine desulfurase family protein (TIGR01976 family)